MHKFKFYVAGNTPASQRAVSNLKEIFTLVFEDQFSLEVIDIFEDSESANQDDIFVVPTLLRLSPEPSQKIIGDFLDKDKLRKGLEILE